MTKERKTVLVVEDQRINRRLVRQFLSTEYDVQEAENGKTALELLRRSRKPYAAILLDIIMPVMDGYEFLRILQNQSQLDNLPIIVMTVDDNPEVEQKVFQLGAWDFVTKPVQPQTILSRLKNAIARSQMGLLERLKYVSEYDTLTGLYNRTKLFAETRRMVDEHPETQMAFIRLDIDRFRLYNSAMGEEEGNKLLKYLAEIVKQSAKSYGQCVYGRIVSDVFCLCEPYSRERVLAQIQRAQELLRSYCADYLLESSCGIYILDEPNVQVETMLLRAAMAVEKCKNQYLNHVAFYDKVMGQRLLQEQAISNDMRTAMSERQFVVYLQPKYDLKTDRPYGAEALVRWNHPQRGLISPGAFIPVFEQNGLIANLDNYVWESVCALLHKWKMEGRTMQPISVNMSRVSLYNPHVLDVLIGLLEKYKVESSLLNLEVTESAYMSNPNLMKSTIRRLQAAGFTIMMDDFGSGYSSLNTLKEIDVDILKIDMKFMPEGVNSERSEKILSSMVRMARWLGMPVVAEGVETQQQKQFLESIGCGYVQGYYYARPMPVKEYEALLERCEAPVLPLEKEIQQIEDTETGWSSSTQVDDILKSILLPVSVFEYNGTKLEMIRVNKAYTDEFGDYQTGEEFKHLALEDEQKVVAAFEMAMNYQEQAECEFFCIIDEKVPKWYRLKLQLMKKSGESGILCGIYMDITTEKNYERQLQSIYDKDGTRMRKMLVVDDQEISRDILKALFEKQFEVLEAQNGSEALELMRHYGRELSVILLDMIMPIMGGEDFLREKKQLPGMVEIPVVVISTESDVSIQQDMLRLGVSDYITKPFVPEIAAQRVQNVIKYRNRFHQMPRTFDE